MPSVKQSAKVNLNDWRQVEGAPQMQQSSIPKPDPVDPTARSPYMLTSMPLMASTGDAFARQFYGRDNLPSQRVLPAKRGAGA